MILTEEKFEEGISINGSFSSKQLILLGLNPKKMGKGWKKIIIGKNYPDEIIEQFISLKNKHLNLKIEKEIKELVKNRPKSKHGYTKQNIDTINEAKSNLVLGLRKVDLDDYSAETKKDKHYYQNLSESEWKVILDSEQRRLFNLPPNTEIIIVK